MKTISIKDSTGKALKQIQLDDELSTLDEAIKSLIEKKQSIDRGEY